MTGGGKKGSPSFSPKKEHQTIIHKDIAPPGLISFPTAAIIKNKRPVNMRPAAMILIAHLDLMAKMRPAMGLIKAKAAKKKEVPASYQTIAPPAKILLMQVFPAAFLERCLAFLVYDQNFRRRLKILLDWRSM